MLVRETSKPGSPRQIELLLIALALVFGWLGAVSLTLQRGDPLALTAIAVLSAVAVLAHLWLGRVAQGRDVLLLPLATLLTGFGLLSIARVAPNFLPRQLLSLVVSVAAMLAVAASRDRLRWLRRFKYTWLIAAFVLLLATLVFGVNPSGFGARLWLSVAGLFVQPSEILRLLVIAFLAAYFAERLESREWRSESNRHSPLATIHSQAPTIVMWLVALILLVTQQDLGAASLLLITFAFMLYLATASARLPLILLGAMLMAGGIGYFLSDRVAQRLNTWLNPWADPQGSSFQVVQSLIAVASGGVFGQGINQGRPDYVPAVHTDFPFVVVGEEFGLLGAIALLACLALVSLRGWRIALVSRTAYRMLLAGGLAAAIAVQVFVILGGNLSLVPLTGVTLPFVSYGGSSLLVSYVSIGLLIRLSADNQRDVQTTNSMLTPFAHAAGSLAAPRRAMTLCASLFAVLGLTSGVWSVMQSNILTARADNPRRVDAELAIVRGAILDRHGEVVAINEIASTENRVPRYQRHYRTPEASPAIGYYSQRYGVDGIEAFADAQLGGRRTAWDDLLHRPQVGAPVTLTLDMRLQTQLQRALQSAVPNTVTRGAALMLDATNGELLALASAPAFDPNTLDETWSQLSRDSSAPLVNRATQGLYQPGALLRWMVETTHARRTTHNRGSSFIARLSSFDLDKPVPFELPNQAVPYPATVTVSETLGQGALRVTPLRVAVAAAQLATGAPITPTLIRNSPHAASSGVATDVAPFITFARIGEDRVVGWHVQVTGGRVLVVAVEMREADATVLARVERSVNGLTQSRGQ